MSQTIQNIRDKVDLNIAAKAVTTPDPTKVSAADHAEIEHDTLDVLEDLLTQVGGPASPAGVSWDTLPVVEITGSDLDVSNGTVNAGGTLINIPGTTLSLTLPSSGFQQPYSLVADYLNTTPVYEVIAGTVVAENASYVFPPIPDDRLWVQNFMVTNAGIAGVPVGDPTKLPIQAARVNSNVISFQTDTIYGGPATPRTGNITFDLTNAKDGVTNKMYHNSGTEPTINTKAIGDNTGVGKQMSGSGDYELGVKNIIYFSYTDGEVEYTISQ